MTIVDAHAHIWTKDAPPYPWDRSLGFEPDFLAPAADLVEAMDLAGVDRAVLVQPSCYGWDNGYILETANRHSGKFAAIVLVDPMIPEAPNRLTFWVEEHGARGLRLNAARFPDGTWLSSPQTRAVWERASELAIPIGLLLEPHQLPLAEAVMDLFPGASVVIDHLARIRPRSPEFRQHLVRLLSLHELPNCCVKLSGFYALSDDGYPYEDLRFLVGAVFEAFGPRRLLWGSDWPLATRSTSYQTLVRSLDALLPGLDPADRSWIMAKTASGLWFSESSTASIAAS